MEVEVVFPRVCGAFYQAYIKDIDIQNGTALLTFPREWKPSAWVELSYIRLPVVAEATSVRESFGNGSKVEALLPHHDNEPPGWWTGTLLKSRGELHVVEFQSGAEKYQDIVDQDKLRSPNSNQPLSKIKLYRKEFPVSEEIHDYCQRPSIHENFRNKIKALCVKYSRDSRSLIVLGTDEMCLDRASLLIEMHFRDLRTQKSLLSKNEAAQRYYQQQQSQHRVLDSGLKEIRFHVPTELVGMAIGREGANVNEARKINGISSVEFDDYSSMFSVKGENDEALKKAREKLEFARDVMLIPKNLAGKVIGKKGNVIQEILEKSRVHNVKVVGEEEAAGRNIDVQAQVPFDFIGRKSEIDNAKMMMEYHLEHLKKVDAILQSQHENSPQSDETFFPAPGLSHSGYRRGYGRMGRGGYPGNYRGRPRDRTSDTVEDGGEDMPPPSNEAHDSDVDHKLSDEVSHSGSDSEDSTQDQQPESDEKSAPEDDMQGPDRRRQQSAPRGRGGGPRGGRGRNRGGHGYRSQRQGRSGGGGGGGGGGGRGRYTESSGGGGGRGGKEEGARGPIMVKHLTECLSQVHVWRGRS